MRVSVAAIGAVSLGSHVLAEAPLNIVGIPVIKEIADIDGQWKFDACHKVDSAVDGLIWPCASQLRTRVKFCPQVATTAAQRIAQRDCLCGVGSSFLVDAVACSECKVQNGLQPATQREHWTQYYNEVGDKYCKRSEVPLSFEAFTEELNNRMPVPEGGQNLNQHVGVVDPRIYYESAHLPVPKTQGAGKFTPAPTEVGHNDTAPVAVTDPLAGQVKVPVFIVVVNLPSANETNTASIRPTTPVSTSAPFRNTTQPTSTFLTITTTSSSTSSTTTSINVLPATSVVAAPGTVSGPVEEHTVVIDGQRCVVLIMWIIVDCSPKVDAGGNFAIDFENTGIDKTEPVMKLENGAQFDKVKDAMADAGKNEMLAEQAKQRVDTAAPVVAAPDNASNKELLPAKQSTGGSKGPSSNEIICPDGTEIIKGPSGGSEAGASAPVGTIKPIAANLAQDSSKPAQDSSNPAQNAGNPAQNAGNPAQNSANPAQNSANPAQDSGKPAQDSSSPAQDFGKPAQDSSKPAQNAGKPAQNAGKPSQDAANPAQNSANPAQNSSSRPGSSVGPSDAPACVCPATSTAPATPDAKEICTKSDKTKNDCLALCDDDVRSCLCSEASFAHLRFFDEAIICARRDVDARQGEFEAQIFFEVKARYCQHKQFGNDFAAAYASVDGEWREARNPNPILS
ncbi:hypothetical protein CCM_01124 [Cordyceps militaris CM01]|uniref:Uncharacterized protein n=1 Tax=Cordyceps militaris (strain CM01) TaxID=983644 RepID=G3J386_CORMM|nr:uncharacterized protein CCM_01124 [Cordyceps militaris CM01]EGX96467.1 hypothetical protein CCM_01124 [Cordyceps militaris CM01]